MRATILMRLDGAESTDGGGSGGVFCGRFVREPGSSGGDTSLELCCWAEYKSKTWWQMSGKRSYSLSTYILKSF